MIGCNRLSCSPPNYALIPASDHYSNHLPLIQVATATSASSTLANHHCTAWVAHKWTLINIIWLAWKSDWNNPATQRTRNLFRLVLHDAAGWEMFLLMFWLRLDKLDNFFGEIYFLISLDVKIVRKYIDFHHYVSCASIVKFDKLKKKVASNLHEVHSTAWCYPFSGYKSTMAVIHTFARSGKNWHKIKIDTFCIACFDASELAGRDCCWWRTVL